MKKPDEIKKGLECCECSSCPWHSQDKGCLWDDYFALDYIKQLEADKAELLQKIKQLERERDAAVRDLTLYPCFSCNNQSRTLCNDCLRNRSNALNAAGKFLPDNYEWRGVCEENGGAKMDGGAD